MPHDIFDKYDKMEFGAYSLSDRRPFAPPGTKPTWTRSRPFDVVHIKLDLTFERLQDESFKGLCATSIKAVKENAQSITFDAISLNIETVQDSRGNQLEHNYDEAKLTVTLNKPLPRGLDETIVIRYTCTKPVAGLYWVLPNKHYPKEPIQVWSQGQDEDNRYWFPCVDSPNEKATTEVIVTVPKDYETLSNGELVSKKKQATKTTFHWLLDVPHSIYLVSLVIGKYTITEEVCDGVPLRYYIPVGHEANANRSFSKTCKMLRFYQDKLGVPYPFKAYTQICVANFTFGGMENSSATTLTDLTLHDERAHMDYESDGLVAHELSHMWFGDLITTKTWAHAWLHEGYATYLDPLFIEFDKGKEEFLYEMLENAERYMREDASQYRRPIVTNVFELPMHLFDAHLYPGGAWRLHMLRHILGEETWWKVCRHFLLKHAKDVVETVDFQRSIEAITGDPMDSFFEQWIYEAGFPEFTISQSWDADQKLLKLVVKQTQKPENKTPEVFVVPIDVHLTTEKETKEFKIKVEQREQTFYLPITENPLMVEFDPGYWVLKKVTFDRPETMLRYQLKHAKEIMSRIEAAKTLAKKGTHTAIEALKEAVLKDTFWGVQVQAATALGSIPDETAMQALIACTKVKHHKARRAVATALGNYRDDRAAAALLPLLKEDESYFVEAAAALALGKTKSKKAFSALQTSLTKDSFREVIRAGILRGLAELDDERGIPIACEWASYGKPYSIRNVALEVLGKLGKYRPDRKEILDAITAVFKEAPDALSFRPYIWAISALAERGHSDALTHLLNIQNNDPRPKFQIRARRAIKKIREGKDKGEEIKRLREDMEKIQKENVSLRDRLSRLESNVFPPKKATSRKRAKPRKLKQS